MVIKGRYAVSHLKTGGSVDGGMRGAGGWTYMASRDGNCGWCWGATITVASISWPGSTPCSISSVGEAGKGGH